VDFATDVIFCSTIVSLLTVSPFNALSSAISFDKEEEFRIVKILITTTKASSGSVCLVLPVKEKTLDDIFVMDRLYGDDTF
jgi:hypothetical protein